MPWSCLTGCYAGAKITRSSGGSAMDLTAELVALVDRTEPDPGPDPGYR